MELSMKPGRITAKTVQNDKAAEVCYTEKGAVFSRAGNENNRNWCSWKICNCEGTEQLRKLIKIGTKQKKSGIWQLDRHAPDFFVS